MSKPDRREFLKSSMAMALAPPPPLAINPRQIEKTATVYAVFAIE